MTKTEIKARLSTDIVELIDLSGNLHDRPIELAAAHLSAILQDLQTQYNNLIKLIQQEAD